MSEKTHAEIIAEMRQRAKRPDFVSQDVLKSCADELDAAHKRELGDCAKLREVVDAMMYEAFALCDSCVKPAAERGKLLAKWCNKLRAALDATEKEGGDK